MDKKFKIILLISLAFHLIFASVFIYFLSKKTFSLKYKEEKKITLSIKKVTKKEIMKNITKNLYSKKMFGALEKGDIEDKFKIESDISMNNNVKINVNNKTYSIKTGNINLESIDNNDIDLFEDENFNKNIEEELKLLDISPVRFVDGEKRNLVSDFKEELNVIDLSFNTNCKVMINIDGNGNVVSTEMLESTGDIEKDNKILSVIKKWKFEENSKLNQVAIVELKYYLK